MLPSIEVPSRGLGVRLYVAHSTGDKSHLHPVHDEKWMLLLRKLIDTLFLYC